MHRVSILFVLLVTLTLGCGQANSEVFLQQPSGQLTVKTSFAATVASAEAVNKTVVVTGNTPITGTVTIPSTVGVRVENGGYFSGTGSLVFSGGPVEFNGYVFRSSGTVTGLKYSIPQWFGAKGDGVNDDSAALQAFLNIGGEIPPGVYITQPLTVVSNTVIKLSPETILKAKTGYTTLQCLLNVVNVSNVIIHGNNGKIQMLKTEYSSGEWRHGVNILGGTDIHIYNLQSIDSGGDGFYVGRSGGAGTHSKRISLVECYANNNRRQGLSIVSVDKLDVIGGSYEGTSGTAPQYGIDIEPNDSSDEMANVNLVGVKTKNNSGGGFLIALSNFVATSNKTVSISLLGCKSYNDGGISEEASLRVTGNVGVWANTLYGSVTVIDFQAISPVFSGIMITRWDYLKAPRLAIDNVSILDPNANNTATQSFDKCGVVAMNFAGTPTVGNFTLNNIRVYGSNIYSPFYVYDTGGAVRDFTARDVIGVGVTPTSGYSHFVSSSRNYPNSSITYSNEQIVQLGNSQAVEQYPGQTIEFTAGGAFTLPTCANVIGNRLKFRNNGNYTVQIRPTGSDLIRGWSTTGGLDLIMNRQGDTVILVATAAGWAPEYVSWYAQRSLGGGTTSPRRIVWTSGSAPSSGTWEVGDMAINVNATVGQPKGWRCTVAGAPGTWVSEGNL